MPERRYGLSRKPLSALALILLVMVSMLAPNLRQSAKAETPMGGSISTGKPTASYSGSFTVSNAGGEAGMPVCVNPAQPCDNYALGVNVPDATYSVSVSVQFTNTLPGGNTGNQNELDLYVYNVAGNVVASSISTNDPNTTSFIVPVAGTSAYTVTIVPSLVAGPVNYTAAIALVKNPPPPSGGGTTGPTGPAPVVPGNPRFQNYAAPDGLGTTAGEPSIGIDWKTGAAMMSSDLQTLRITFDDCSSPARATWKDVSATTTSAESLDPILYTDCITGRTFVSQLAGGTEIAAYTDDDGSSYTPGGVVATNSVDHQTIGGGPFSTNALVPFTTTATTPYSHAVYYCSQGVLLAQCELSRDGGLTFGLAVRVYDTTQCGGLHGHVKVDPLDGTVFLPNKSCGGQQGLAISTDNGTTWTVNQIAGTTSSTWDPSVSVGANHTVYFGYRNGDGHAHVAVLKRIGTTVSVINDTDVGTPYGIQRTAFPEMIAGDDDRASFAFLGTPTSGDDSLGNSINFEWHLYVASTFDHGATWSTTDATPNDPVQRGPICSSGTVCSSSPNTRNLLDFMDEQVDQQGRVLVGYADGCIASCDTAGMTQTNNSFSDLATIARQSGGKRLFHQYDPVEPVAPGAPLITATVVGSSVAVSWPEPDNGGSPITGYKIYRSTSPNTAQSGTTLLASTTGTTTTNVYTDTTVAPGTTYYYRVTALNAIGQSTNCGEVSPALHIVMSSCSIPGVTVATDPAGDQKGAPAANAQLDILSVSVAEPASLPVTLTASPAITDPLVFTMKVSSLATLVPGNAWRFLFYPGTAGYYLGMDYVGPGVVNYTYGSLGTVGIVGNAPTQLGTATGTYSTVGNNNTIVIAISKNLVGNPLVGSGFGVIGRTYASQSAAAVLLQTTAADYTGQGAYTVVGNMVCGPPASSPQSTATPVPGTTSSPVPGTTNTAMPLPTATQQVGVPVPTSTAVPSATFVSSAPLVPSATTVPSATPVPTSTSAPTSTAVHSATTVPSATSSRTTATVPAATPTATTASAAANVSRTPPAPTRTTAPLVTAPTIAPIATILPNPLLPVITVTPGSSQPGQVVTVTGQHFAPGELVTLALNGAALLTSPAALYADSQGRIRATFTVPDGVLGGANSLSAIGTTSRGTALTTLIGHTLYASRFYFAGGQNTQSVNSTLQLLNPGATRAKVALTFYSNDGGVRKVSLTIPAHSQRSVPVAALTRVPSAFGLSLTASTRIAAQLGLSRSSRDGDAILGNTGLGRDWYLAEGYTGLTFHETVSILNPDAAHEAHVVLHVLALGGKGSKNVTVTVRAHSHAVIDVNKLLPGRSLSIVATSDRGIVVERTLTFSKDGHGGDYGLTARAGINVAATSWLFAEGTTAGRFETYLTVLNPGRTTARITARFYGVSGRLLAQKSITVAGQARGNIVLARVLHATSIASVVTSNQPIVVERPEYFGSPNGTKIAGSDAFGVNGGAAQWSFAGGQTGGTSEFLLLFNPSRVSVPVNVIFYGSNGAMLRRQILLGRNARATIDVGKLGSAVDALHGVTLTSSNGQGFVVEQTVFAPNLSNLRTTQGLAQ